MTLEELKEIFNKATVVPGPRGYPPTYTYYIPYGSGVVDTDKVDETLLESIESHFIFAGYTDQGEPIFTDPSFIKKAK